MSVTVFGCATRWSGCSSKPLRGERAIRRERPVATYLRRLTDGAWESLRGQFGTDLANTKQGRAQYRWDFQRNLREVLLVHREGPSGNMRSA
jgi:hypothetical protein